MLVKFRKAVYDALTNLGWRVYTKVPYNAPLPYIVVGLNQQSEWGVKDALASRIVMTDIHVWSGYDGYKEAEDKMDSIIEALYGLTDEHLSVGYVGLVMSTILEEENAVHGIVRMEYKILEA